MKRERFFATLHYARRIFTPDKTLRGLMLSAFRYAYTLGWKREID